MTQTEAAHSAVLDKEDSNTSTRSAMFNEKIRRSENKILIIDADDQFRSIIKSTYRPEYEVIELKEGEDALELYKKHLPDVLFIDIKQPQGNGFDILSSILKIDKDAYVLIVSADAFQTNVLKSAELGARGFVVKPARQDSLNGYIKKCPSLSNLSKK